MKKILLFAGILVLGLPLFLHAQELHQDLQATWKGRVERILEERTETLPGFDLPTEVQSISIELLEGPRKGEFITLQNDLTVLTAGDRLLVNYLRDIDGRERYIIQDIDRTNALLVLALIFIGAVIAFGGWQGFRSLLSLAGSFALIFYVLFPQLLAGASPVIIGPLIAVGILALALYVTHGFNRVSSAALLGTVIAILAGALFAEFAVSFAHLSGFAEEASVYLNLNSRGAIDLRGLLLAAIIIGVLGVLDDVAITQAAAVKEIKKADGTLSPRELYRRAMAIGREHVGALVNTLALAYTGAALPLLLLFFTSEASFALIINREIFAAEIVRTVAGSIAIILSVPTTTIISIWLLKGDEKTPHRHFH